jgi:zinc protease
MVANSFLGEHRKSYGRLYDKIRTTRSMNYGDYSYIEWYESGGQNMLPVAGVPRRSNYFSLWIRPVQIAEGLKQQYAELKDIETGHAHFALRLALREIDNLVKNGMTQQDFDATRRFLRSYNKLDDVNRAIRKYWQVNNLFVTVVTDDSEASPLKKALEENRPSPMSYSNLVKEGLPKTVVEEDAIIASFPLQVKSVTIIDNKETFKKKQF